MQQLDLPRRAMWDIRWQVLLRLDVVEYHQRPIRQLVAQALAPPELVKIGALVAPMSLSRWIRGAMRESNHRHSQHSE